MVVVTTFSTAVVSSLLTLLVSYMYVYKKWKNVVKRSQRTPDTIQIKNSNIGTYHNPAYDTVGTYRLK